MALGAGAFQFGVGVGALAGFVAAEDEGRAGAYAIRFGRAGAVHFDAVGLARWGMDGLDVVLAADGGGRRNGLFSYLRLV